MSVEQGKKLIKLLLRPSTIEELKEMLSEDSFSRFVKDCIEEELLNRKRGACNA